MTNEHDDSCPVCSGPGALLGTLGRTEHYRCRDCGMDFSVTIVKGGFVKPSVREHMSIKVCDDCG